MPLNVQDLCISNFKKTVFYETEAGINVANSLPGLDSVLQSFRSNLVYIFAKADTNKPLTKEIEELVFKALKAAMDQAMSDMGKKELTREDVMGYFDTPLFADCKPGAKIDSFKEIDRICGTDISRFRQG